MSHSSSYCFYLYYLFLVLLCSLSTLSLAFTYCSHLSEIFIFKYNLRFLVSYLIRFFNSLNPHGECFLLYYSVYAVFTYLSKLFTMMHIQFFSKFSLSILQFLIACQSFLFNNIFVFLGLL